MPEEFKVMNENDASRKMKRQQQEWSDFDRSFIKDF